MVLSHMSPQWFFGYDVGIEMAFAIVTLCVAIFSFRMYSKTSQRLIKYFGLSFLLISISYFIQSVFNFMIVSRLNENVCTIMQFQSVTILDTFGIIIHMLFMTVGLSILLYTTLKDKRLRTMWFLITVGLSVIFLSVNQLNMFYVISTIYLAFISWNYVLNYLNHRKTRTLLVAIAFIFLLFGSVHFLVSVNHQLFYVIGHILELCAYVFILINLYLVQKK